MVLTNSCTTLNNTSRLQKNTSASMPVHIHAACFVAQHKSRSALRSEQSQAARHLLSETLQQCSDVSPSENWLLDKSEHGKPYLIGHDAPAISLSHSANWVACAVAHTASIGIDIEIIKPRNWSAYCEHFFHVEESRWILDGSQHEQNIRGLICWCRKEALTKALGIGNTVSMADIAFTPDGSLLALPEELGSPSGWVSHTDILHHQAVVATVWKN
ncbi:MAG: 4'-phosphopantetheinyl transferase superfamily protein [Oxalobacter sp.]|jgi:phosphopantetheinyl transferase|nr:MAG: 4'-phosphopantetheinyl transferase superfamily protein [Oxalobacter sp.]